MPSLVLCLRDCLNFMLSETILSKQFKFNDNRIGMVFGFKLLDARNTKTGLKYADFPFFNYKCGRFLDELFSYLLQHP